MTQGEVEDPKQSLSVEDVLVKLFFDVGLTGQPVDSCRLRMFQMDFLLDLRAYLLSTLSNIGKTLVPLFHPSPSLISREYNIDQEPLSLSGSIQTSFYRIPVTYQSLALESFSSSQV